ncbi:MAG: hypothetical protein DRO00_01655 [Thermoproteota archaeon]|nr:MAG: hypothetical protein DRO00_01655 [Candidatus Korarchaeota archaeon]
MDEKKAIDILRKLLPLDRALRHLVVTSGRGRALSSIIYENSPFLFARISEIQLTRLFGYLEKWIKNPKEVSRVIIPGSCGKSLDRFGWASPPTTAMILIPNPFATIIMHDTVLPPNFSRIFDMEELSSWYAIYSHPHEDHSPRCLPALINSTTNWKLRHILVSRKCFMLVVAGSIVYSQRLERDVKDLIRYMAPEKGRRVQWIDPSTERLREQFSEVVLKDGEFKFVCLGEAPHSPPEPPISISLEYKDTAYVFLSDGTETRDGSFIHVENLLPNLKMLESQKAELFVIGGIFRQHNTYPSVFQAPYVAKALSQYGLRVKAVYMTHLPSEQYISLSYLKRKVREAEIPEVSRKDVETAIDILMSYGGTEKDPVYKFSVRMIKEEMKDWLGYEVPIYSADTVRAVPSGILYKGITVQDIFWRVSMVEDEQILSELRKIESELGLK